MEDDVDPVAAREFLTSPSKLLQVDLPFIKELQKQAPSFCHLWSVGFTVPVPSFKVFTDIHWV